MPRPYPEFRAFSTSSHSKKFWKEKGVRGRRKLFSKSFLLPRITSLFSSQNRYFTSAVP